MINLEKIKNFITISGDEKKSEIKTKKYEDFQKIFQKNPKNEIAKIKLVLPKIYQKIKKENIFKHTPVKIPNSNQNTIDHSRKINYKTGAKYLLSRNETSFKINRNLKIQITDTIDRYNTIDCIENFDDDKAFKENEIFLSLVFDKLKDKNIDINYFDYENNVFRKKKDKFKLFLPERMNQLKRKVELELGDPYLYLNKNKGNDILSQNYFLCNIFNKNMKSFQKLNQSKEKIRNIKIIN